MLLNLKVNGHIHTGQLARFFLLSYLLRPTKNWTYTYVERFQVG